MNTIDTSDDLIIDPSTISAVPGCINGLSEVDYLLGAVTIVEREYASANLRLDVKRLVDGAERLDNLKNCLINVLRRGA